MAIEPTTFHIPKSAEEPKALQPVIRRPVAAGGLAGRVVHLNQYVVGEKAEPRFKPIDPRRLATPTPAEAMFESVAKRDREDLSSLASPQPPAQRHCFVPKKRGSSQPPRCESQAGSSHSGRSDRRSTDTPFDFSPPPAPQMPIEQGQQALPARSDSGRDSSVPRFAPQPSPSRPWFSPILAVPEAEEMGAGSEDL